MPFSSRFVNTFLSVAAGLVAVMALAFGSFALYRHYATQALSPTVLFASYHSGVAGTMLVFRADGTFHYQSAAFIYSDELTGYYTQTDSLIRLDRLPKTGLLERPTLVVRRAPLTETGHGVWLAGPDGRVDSTLVVFTIFPAK